MKKLVTKPIKRFFAFGCSFTNWLYPTWAEIIGYDLNIEYYNYGRAGAGNQFIFNMVMQADSYHHFNEDDLIIVEWTSITREDRYNKGSWITPGNIFSQDKFDLEFIEKWADFDGYLVRDLALIKATSELLKNKKAQHHILAMAPIATTYNQWGENKPEQTSTSEQLVELYKPYLDEMLPSFYDVLWKGSIENKMEEERQKYGRFIDGHPTLLEHLNFMEKIFDHKFKEDTKKKVLEHYNIYEDFLNTIDFQDKNFNHDMIFTKVPPEVFFIKSNPQQYI